MEPGACNACLSIRGVASTGPDVRQRYTKGSYETDQPKIMRPASIWNAAGFVVGRRCGAFFVVAHPEAGVLRGVSFFLATAHTPGRVFGDYEGAVMHGVGSP